MPLGNGRLDAPPFSHWKAVFLRLSVFVYFAPRPCIFGLGSVYWRAIHAKVPIVTAEASYLPFVADPAKVEALRIEALFLRARQALMLAPLGTLFLGGIESSVVGWPLALAWMAFNTVSDSITFVLANRLLRQPQPVRGIFNQPYQCVCQRLSIAGLDQDAVLTLLDHFFELAHVGSNHRQAGGHAAQRLGYDRHRCLRGRRR